MSDHSNGGWAALAEPRDGLVEHFTAALDAEDWPLVEDLLAVLFPEPDFPSEGRRVACWVAVHVRQTKGRFADVPLVVEPWQYEFLCELYRLVQATDDDTGELLVDAEGEPILRRAFQEALLLLPRKNGKSTLASAIGLYQLVADGEDAPEVYVAAGKRDQARAIHNQAKQTVEVSPGLVDFLVPQRDAILFPENRGVFKVLSSDAKLEHGSNPSTNLIDEKWAHPSNDLATALTSGTGARDEPLSLTVSTVGHDLEGPLGEDVVSALKDCDLEIRDDGFLTIGRDYEAGFLLWIYGPPFDVDAARGGKGFHYTADLDSPETWRRSNPATWIRTKELGRQRKRLRLTDFRRFRVNAWTEADDLWLPEGAWAELLCDGMELVPRSAGGLPIVVGVDIGQKKDRAAIVVVQPTGEIATNDDGEELDRYRVSAEILTPPTDGRALDIATVRAAIRSLHDHFDVQAVAYDPWRFEESAQMLADEGVVMVEWPQSNERMCPATSRLFDAIVSGRLEHNGDAEFAAHVNAAATVDVGERGYRLTKRKATRPMDACVALAFALDEADQGETHGSKYEEGGLVVLD